MAAKVKQLPSRGSTPAEKVYLVEIFKGMAITLRHFLRNLWDNSNLYVRHYPEVQPDIPAHWRGRHRLLTRPDGTPKCVACFMCQTNCPADCIMIKAGERTDGVTEKVPVRFTIDLAECIYCGFCVEACPEDAIRMDTGIYAFTSSNREEMKIEMDEMLSLKGGYSEEEYQKGLEGE
jgi:NADH-quinone oxidoreductase subunit I